MTDSKNIKSWSQMTKEEKLTRIIPMKAEGYSNKEIGEFYGVSEDAVRKTLQRSEKGTKRTLDEIHNSPVKVEITTEMLSSIFEQIESLKLELASVKKLQVESASIERLEDTEFNYFIYKGNELISKFKTVEECSDYCSSTLGFKSNSSYIERQIEAHNGSFNLREYRIVQSFKKDNDRLEKENSFIKLETNELKKKFQILEESSYSFQ